MWIFLDSDTACVYSLSRYYEQTLYIHTTGTVLCPDSSSECHQWKTIHEELIPVKVQDAYKLVFVHEKFMIDVLAARRVYSKKNNEMQ